jgi:flagellar basal body-associated protein FliL
MGKFINQKPQSIIAFLIVILVITIGLIYSYLFIYGSYTDTQSIIIQEVKIDDYFISIKGTTTNSAEGFSGYNYSIKNKNLYIKLRYSLVNKLNPVGDFNIRQGGEFEGILKVYLRGDQKENLKLLWSK